MLDQIHGYLVNISDNNAEVFLPSGPMDPSTDLTKSPPGAISGSSPGSSPGIPGLSYQVMMSSYAADRLFKATSKFGTPIRLWLVHYLESQAQGATMVPRLAGFVTEKDRRFYELFRSVKGIGPRKALKSLALDTQQIAGAIASRDAKLLQTLPEIGKKMAENIATSLHDRVSEFLIPGTDGLSTVDTETGEVIEAAPQTSGMMSEALEALLLLGENRHTAMELLQKALSASPPPADTQSLLKAAFELKNV